LYTITHKNGNNLYGVNISELMVLLADILLIDMKQVYISN